MKIGTGKSYAKIILIGEHAVVYGEPAIALPVKSIRYAKVEPILRPGSPLFTGDLKRVSYLGSMLRRSSMLLIKASI